MKGFSPLAVRSAPGNMKTLINITMFLCGVTIMTGVFALTFPDETKQSNGDVWLSGGVLHCRVGEPVSVKVKIDTLSNGHLEVTIIATVKP